MRLSAWEVADALYGDVNRVTDIMAGVFSIDCAGHGGFLVDVETFPLDPRIAADDRFLIYETKSRDARWRIFEEDVAWAVLLHFHPAVKDAALRAQLFSPTAPFDTEIPRILAAYYPDLVA